MNYLNSVKVLMPSKIFKGIRVKIKNRIHFFKTKLIKILYHVNFILINLNNNQYSGYFDKSKCFTKKISISDEFLKEVKNDLEIKKRDHKAGHINYKYLYYVYSLEYLKQVNLAWNIDRKKYFNFLNNNFGNLIKKIYNGNNYRVEQIFLYETLNKNSTETYNLNADFHKDGDLAGSIKIIIYLCDVNDSNGPFCYKELDVDKNEVTFKVKGETGTTVIFQQTECLHSGSNTVNNKRIAVSFLIYPSLRKKVFLYKEKPLNVLCSLNPFTNYS